MELLASSHEILGILEEEVHARSAAELKIEELKDIAVAAILGIASIQSGGVDW